MYKLWILLRSFLLISCWTLCCKLGKTKANECFGLNLASSCFITFGSAPAQKFLHAISPTPASIMSASEISMKTTNTTLFPFSSAEKAANTTGGAAKRSSDTASDSQYWRYDTSQKRQKHGDGDGNKLCFKYLSTGSCDRGEKCHFQHDEGAREQCLRGVCFDFLNKGKCERGPDCNFKHSLQEEDNGFTSRRARSGNANSERLVWLNNHSI